MLLFKQVYNYFFTRCIFITKRYNISQSKVSPGSYSPIIKKDAGKYLIKINKKPIFFNFYS